MMRMRTAAFGAAAVLAAAGFTFQTEPARAEVMVAGMAGQLCVDINQANNQAILWGCHGGSNQNFFTSGYGQQRFGGRCLDMESDRQGANIVLSACNQSSATQRWALSPSGQYKNERGWCMDIPAGRANQGQNLVAWSCNNGRNQMWGRGMFGAAARIAPHLGSAAAYARPGAGFMLSNSGSLIGQAGGNVIATGGGNVIATGGGNIVRLTGGSVIATGGGN